MWYSPVWLIVDCFMFIVIVLLKNKYAPTQFSLKSLFSPKLLVEYYAIKTDIIRHYSLPTRHHWNPQTKKEIATPLLLIIKWHNYLYGVHLFLELLHFQIFIYMISMPSSSSSHTDSMEFSDFLSLSLPIIHDSWVIF